MSAPPLAAEAAVVRLGGRTILDGVTLAIRPGELLGIVGPNGSGKTTLVRALAGLQPLAGGRVALDGTGVERWQRHKLAARLAYLPQGHRIEWPVTVRRVVELGRIPHTRAWHRPTADDHRAVDTAIGRTGVAHLAGRSCTTLSGGEQARVMLARVLAVEASIMLADEPVAALDPRHQIAIMEILHRAAAAGDGVAVVMHDLALASRYCDRVVVLADGRIVADGPPDEALTVATVRDAYGVQALEFTHNGRRFVVPWAVDPGHPRE
ncbi:MAG: ABC transporter ATP-binding protein [Rhodospirillaceae bacterium]|nr:ABC transporter ATP-binding protein [Rhodospirillaceae bacterium]